MSHQQTNQSQQTIEQINITQEVILLDVSKLNHAVMKKKRDQIDFCPEKKTRKGKWSMNGVIKWGN